MRDQVTSQDVRVAPEHPLDLWSLLQSVATKRTERKKAAEPSAVIIFVSYHHRNICLPSIPKG